MPADEQAEEIKSEKNFLDYFSVALSTFGVGFIPLAPGTWGSAVGVLIFLILRRFELNYFAPNFPSEQSAAVIYALNAILLSAFILSGIWAASRAAVIFEKKDPQKVVVDEVIGQLIVFMFVPFLISWKLVLTGFLLFRLFDVWKPYPVRAFETLPGGSGICADDIVAGIYGGICLAVIYAIVF